MKSSLLSLILLTFYFTPTAHCDAQSYVLDWQKQIVADKQKFSSISALGIIKSDTDKIVVSLANNLQTPQFLCFSQSGEKLWESVYPIQILPTDFQFIQSINTTALTQDADKVYSHQFLSLSKNPLYPLSVYSGFGVRKGGNHGFEAFTVDTSKIVEVTKLNTCTPISNFDVVAIGASVKTGADSKEYLIPTYYKLDRFSNIKEKVVLDTSTIRQIGMVVSSVLFDSTKKEIALVIGNSTKLDFGFGSNVEFRIHELPNTKPTVQTLIKISDFTTGNGSFLPAKLLKFSEGYYVLGTIYTGINVGQSTIAIVQLDTNGAIVKTSVIGNSTTATNAVVAKDGSVIIVGNKSPLPNTSMFYTAIVNKDSLTVIKEYVWATETTNYNYLTAISEANGDDFYVTGTSEKGDVSELHVAIFKKQTTSVALENEEENSLQVIPNPVTDFLQLKGFDKKSSYKTLTIMDALGRVVLERNNVSINDDIVVDNLSNGRYFLTLLDENLRRKTIAFTILR